MAYSITEQYTRDIDWFILDNEKHVHVASAGGTLPNIIIERDTLNEANIRIAYDLPEIFDIEINPNLMEFLDINDNSLPDYLTSFISMAKKGFYSYDKTFISNRNDNKYHLVAKPSGMSPNNSESPNLQSLNLNIVIPVEWTPFELISIINNSL